MHNMSHQTPDRLTGTPPEKTRIGLSDKLHRIFADIAFENILAKDLGIGSEDSSGSTESALRASEHIIAICAFRIAQNGDPMTAMTGEIIVDEIDARRFFQGIHDNNNASPAQADLAHIPEIVDRLMALGEPPEVIARNAGAYKERFVPRPEGFQPGVGTPQPYTPPDQQNYPRRTGARAGK